MDSRAISKFFAELRLSRRRAVTQGGAGVAGALIAGGLGQGSSLAQGATPVARDGVDFLFVQSFGSGSLAPSDGDGGYTLTLEQGLGETIYFSDRPDRVVGAVPTTEFLTVFDMTEADPPNAALVSGDLVLVLELTTGSLDETAGTLTYEVTPIGMEELELHFDHAVSDAPGGEVTLNTSHLFIDSVDRCCDPIHRPWCC